MKLELPDGLFWIPITGSSDHLSSGHRAFSKSHVVQHPAPEATMLSQHNKACV